MNNTPYNQIILNYKKNGFVIVKNFFKEKDIENVKIQLLNKISHVRKSNNFYYEKINNFKKLRRIEGISDFSVVAKKIIYSNRILKLIKDIKKKKFDLFKDKLNFKYPGGKGYLPHIDGHFFWKDKNNKIQNGWKKYADDFVNLVIPLEKSNKKNGCLYLAQKKNIKNLGNSFNKITKKNENGNTKYKIK